MRQYADEFHPGIYLLVGKLTMDITECHDLHFLALQRRVRLSAGKGSKTVRDLGDMRDGLPFEHRSCRLVGAEHETALLVDDKDTGVHRVEDDLIIFLPLNLLVACMLKDCLDSIEGRIDDFIILRLRFGEAEGEVAIVDSIKEKRHLMRIAAVAAPQRDVKGQRKKKQDDGNVDHNYITKRVYLPKIFIFTRILKILKMATLFATW